MTPLQRLKTLRAVAVEQAIAVTVAPPLSHAAIVALRSKIGGALPAEVEELVADAGGFTVSGFTVDFSGNAFFEFSAFPRGLAIAHDGSGNFWVVDILADGSWRKVFFIAHDPPVVVLQAVDLASFIEQVFRGGEVLSVTNDNADLVWRTNPILTYAQAIGSNDEGLRSCAEQFGERFGFCDLRHAAPGSGFVWGAAGPQGEVHRAGDELLFAVQQRSPSLFRRMFGPGRVGS